MERDTRTRASQPCLAAPPQADAETAGRHKVISALVKSANRKRASQPCLVAPSQADAETAGRHKVSSANRRPSFHIWHMRGSLVTEFTSTNKAFLPFKIDKFDEQSSNILSADMKHHDYEGPLSRSLKLCLGKAPRKRRLNKQKLRIWKLSQREICQKGAHLIRSSTIKKFREYEASPMRISFIKEALMKPISS